MAETQQFQAKIVGAVACKTNVKDLADRRVQGFVFNVEIGKDQDAFEEADLIELFDGNPVHVIIHNQDRSIVSKFVTAINKYASATRTDGEDSIRYLKVPLTAFRRDIGKPGNLFDLQLEEFIYVEMEPRTMRLGETTPVDVTLKRPAKKEPDDKQTELAGT